MVGYPILDLEKFHTDIGRYLRNLEEVGIRVLAEYGIRGIARQARPASGSSRGCRGRERKICAMGVRCSRWITMHGFALNVNTDLSWFGDIVPCGIPINRLRRLEKELGHAVDDGGGEEGVEAAFLKWSSGGVALKLFWNKKLVLLL